MEYRLYRLFTDGMVGRVREERMPRAEAAILAGQTPMAPGQTGWGIAWGYPESAVEPLPRWETEATPPRCMAGRPLRVQVRPCCGGVTYHFDGCAEDGRTA